MHEQQVIDDQADRAECIVASGASLMVNVIVESLRHNGNFPGMIIGSDQEYPVFERDFPVVRENKMVIGEELPSINLIPDQPVGCNRSSILFITGTTD